MARGSLNSGSARKPDVEKVKISKDSLKKAGQIWSYIKPYGGKFFIGLIFLFLSSIISLAFPALVGAMVDAAQGKVTFDWLEPDLTTVGLYSFILLLGLSIVSFFRIRLFVEVAEKALADIRRDTFKRLLSLPIEFFGNRRVGELNSRLSSDLSQIQDTLTTTIAEMIRQIILLIGGIALLITVSIKLTLLNLSILPVLIICAVLFGKFIRNLSRAAQDKLADSNSIIQETLQGIQNVKAFTTEQYEHNRYSLALKDVIKIAVKAATFRGLFASFIIFCMFGGIVVVIWYGSSLVQSGQITVGELTTYILYSMFVAGSMGSFPELYANIQKALGASERVIEILDEKTENLSIQESQKPVKDKIEGELEFQNVLFRYPSRPDALIFNGLNFKVPLGEKLAIVGPSGAGKSTIASLILQFYTPEGGHVLFDSKKAEEYDLYDLRKQIAIVPQDVLLFGGSIRDNIAYGKLDATEEEIIEAAKKANAHNFITALGEGYNTLVGERGVKLSGGQRQRIAIARAILKDPAILILDEATSSLDSESERLVQQALEKLMVGRTSIIIAHRLSTIKEANKILVLDNGQVAEMGTHDELIKNEEGLYFHLIQLQSITE